MKQNRDLLEAFDAVSDEQWHSAIERFLKGQPLTQLNWEVEQGVTISPLQRRADTTSVPTGWQSAQGGNQWRLTEAFVLRSQADLTASNNQLLDALHKGADALHLQWHYCPSRSDLDQLFKGVLLDLVTLHFEASALEPANFVPAVSTWVNAQQVQGSCALAQRSPAELWPLLATALPTKNWRWLSFSFYQQEDQTMAKALYQASLWFDFLLKKDYSLTQIVQSMRFEYAIEPRYFVALARIRAFKRCWLALLKGYDSPTVWPWLHAKTVNDAEADQYRNMLVGTTQAMSAVIAGVDSLLVEPSDGQDTATDFTRRIARNVQHLLEAESYLNRVTDPAAGAYYIEHLTTELTEQAWQQFCAL
jgi:methylmalonyl-CoA mutase